MKRWTRTQAKEVLEQCDLITESVEVLRRKAKLVLDESPDNVIMLFPKESKCSRS
jgi:hypothetical protein